MRFLTISILILFYINNGFSNQISLKEILNPTTLNSTQDKLISNKILTNQLQSNLPLSLWMTEFSTSLEGKFKIKESFTGRATNTTESLPWKSTVRQRTPYGLNLNIEYYKEMGSPNFNNLFQEEKYRASAELSLYSDFFGKRSREISKDNKAFHDLNSKSVQTENCLTITLSYIESLSKQQKLKLLEENILNTKKILKKIKKAVKKGALHQTSLTSMKMSLGSSQAQKVNLENSLQDSIIKLENLTGKDLSHSSLKSFPPPNEINVSSSPSLKQELLKQELANIKNKISKIQLENNQDLSLYGGMDSVKFTQNTINIDGKTTFGFIGLKASIKFGDNFTLNEEKRLKALKEIKETELFRTIHTAKKEDTNYKKTLKLLKLSLQSLKKELPAVTRLEKKSYRNFYSGKSRYFEFISTRDQIINFKNTLIDTKSNFWRVYSNHLYFKGDQQALCFQQAIK